VSKRVKKVTTGRKWRTDARRTFLIKLPSGNVARLRNVAVDVLITSGELPDVLSTLAAQTLFDDMDFADIAEEGKTSKQYVELINHVVPAAFDSPTVTEFPEGDDEIALSDIDWSDKVTVFQLALLPVDALQSFRDEQNGDVENVPNGDDDVVAAK
jgi:hypothetical protein